MRLKTWDLVNKGIGILFGVIKNYTYSYRQGLEDRTWDLVDKVISTPIFWGYK